MHRRIPRRSIAVIVAAAATFALAACSDDTPGADTAPAETPASTVAPTTTQAASALPPIIVTVAEAEGTTVEAEVGNTVDLVVDTDVTEWTGSVQDPTIATFTPGKEEGGATFNPSLIAVAAGETEVTLTDKVSDQTVTFTLHVSGA